MILYIPNTSWTTSSSLFIALIVIIIVTLPSFKFTFERKKNGRKKIPYHTRNRKSNNMPSIEGTPCLFSHQPLPKPLPLGTSRSMNDNLHLGTTTKASNHQSPLSPPQPIMAANNEQFYLRYYSGHSGRFGHEFLGTKSNHTNSHNFPPTLPINYSAYEG